MTRNRIRLPHVLALAPSVLLAGCLVGPDYVRPSAPTPPAYKEAQGGWIPAQPADAAPRGDWWTLFDDPVLNELEQKVVVSNQNLAAAEAAYREAEALVAADRAQLFPTLGATASGTRSATNGGVGTITPGSGGSAGTPVPVVGVARNSFQLGASASWEPDLWGKIRRTVEGARASAQASAADLANAQLSAQSQLAVDYVQLRADDELKRLTDDTIEGYKRSLQITQNQYNAGIVAKNDVLTAQVQLANAQAQSADYVRQRQLMEHAIAVLAGMPPAELTIQPTAWTLKTPDVPAAIPSQLLQRRPDVAAAERSAANANAQIGVAVAAYYPTLNLTGDYGLSASSLAKLFSASSTFWSLGANAAETLVDFGARSAKVRQARASYDQSVAQYRQTVLTAFQDVEDQLAAGRQLALEQPLRAQASQAADANEIIALNQYRAGLTDYTAVVVAQAAALSARQTLITTQSSRMAAAIQLITSLGGGWSTAQLPTLNGGVPSPL
jgi:NodT family efflux transporter outer membrane factor (OMF) lipoprotein